MINTRLISLIRKEFIQIARDPRTLVISLLIPVMQLFMLGYAAINDVRNLPMAIFDQDRSAAARDILDAFRALLLKGVGPGAIQKDIFALIFFGVVLIGAASLRFRKRLD
jgi:hypothetical protein